MLEPQPPTRDNPHAIVWHLLAGAVPPLLATVAGMAQLLRPYMPAEHIGMLYIAILAGWIVPMAVAVWCKAEYARKEAQSHADAAEERDAEIIDNQRKLLSQLGAHQRSLKGVHNRLEKLEGANSGTDSELQHLRRLIIGEAVPVPEQRLGPRSLP